MPETTKRATVPSTVTAARARNKMLRKAFRSIDNLMTVATKYGPVTTDRYVLWVHEQAPDWLRPALDSLPCDGIRYDYQHAAKTVSDGKPWPLSDAQDVRTDAFERVIDRVREHRIEDALTPRDTVEIGGTTARVYRSGNRGALVDASLHLDRFVIADGGQREATKFLASAEMWRSIARRALGSPHNMPLAILTPDGALAGTVCPIHVTDETLDQIVAGGEVHDRHHRVCT